MFLWVRIVLAFAVSFQWESTISDMGTVQEVGEHSFGRLVFLLVMRKTVWWQKAHLVKLICRLSFIWQSYQNKSRDKKPKWFYDAFLLFSIPVWLFTEYCNQTKENSYASVSEMRRGDGFDKIWVADKMTSKAAISIWI